MEIEAKFAVTNREIFQRLCEIQDLAGYTVETGQEKQVQDRYLDTPDRALLAAGFALRRRQQGTGIQMTLKGLGHAAGAVHRREELEVTLTEDQPLANWPESPVRARVRALIGTAPLQPLFDLSQVRRVRRIHWQSRHVAEMSVDDVHFMTTKHDHQYFEVEVELSTDGTEDDLAKIAAHLQTDWQLTPETQSKFARALALQNGDT